MDNDILHARSISSNGVGIRIKRVARIVTSPTARMILLRGADTALRDDTLDELDLPETAIKIYSPGYNPLLR